MDTASRASSAQTPTWPCWARTPTAGTREQLRRCRAQPSIGTEHSAQVQRVRTRLHARARTQGAPNLSSVERDGRQPGAAAALPRYCGRSTAIRCFAVDGDAACDPRRWGRSRSRRVPSAGRLFRTRCRARLQECANEGALRIGMGRHAHLMHAPPRARRKVCDRGRCAAQISAPWSAAWWCAAACVKAWRCRWVRTGTAPSWPPRLRQSSGHV